MNISYKWLSKYVDLNVSPDELAAIITRAGLEVESYAMSVKIPDGVIVARILERNKHENSDHLSVCKVDTGSEVLQIVCGAPNCDAGNVVPLATIGTVFEEDGKPFTIKKGKLRGVESFGMMCSEQELGVSENNDGLMILPQDWKLGTPLSQYIEGDTVYDCSPTPNRADWLSHVGVARDVAVLLGKEMKLPEIPAFPYPENSDWNELVTVTAPDLCPHYTARVISGVQVKPSPEWLQKELSAVGIRPINNIVDITNYVMMELGQPLHAFDSRLIKDKKIIVRRAAEGEKIVALDGKDYELNPNMLVIADSEKPVAIAGVMGGEYSGIQPDTAEIILESAYFDPDSIRATSRKLGLSSDASFRYERGTDPEMVTFGGNRAVQLILELAGGTLVSPVMEKRVPPQPPRRIRAEFSKINSLLGMQISADTMTSILTNLGFRASDPEDGACTFTVPSWRSNDVVGRADLAEEVARIYGLENLPDVPIQSVCQDFSGDSLYATECLRAQLTSVGLQEVMNNSMIDPKTALSDGCFTDDDLLRMNNPISADLSVMRPSVFPCVLNNIRYNIAHKNLDLAIFEIGHAFCKNPEKYPEERDELVIALTGRAHAERYSQDRKVLYDFFDLKGMIETLLEIYRCADYTVEKLQEDDPRFVKGCAAELKAGKTRLGVFGLVKPELTKGMRLTTPLYAAVIQLDSLRGAGVKPVSYKPVSSFPSTSRDVAFLAPSDMDHKTVIDFIRKSGLADLESVELFDIFEGGSVGAGKKSMAYTLNFRAKDRTLTDDEVNKSYEKIRLKLEKGLGVELR